MENNLQNCDLLCHIFYIVHQLYLELFEKIKNASEGFPGGPVVKNPLWNLGNTGSIPGQGTKVPQTTEQLSLSTATSGSVHHNKRSHMLQLGPYTAKLKRENASVRSRRHGGKVSLSAWGTGKEVWVRKVGKHCKCHVLPFFWKPLAFWPSSVSSWGGVEVRSRK